MGRQIRPAKVYQMVTAELQSRVMPKYQVQEPPWYPVLYNIPPAETITRPAAVQLRTPNKKQRRPKNVYRPQRIEFPEDRLRQAFYKDHPWELARPRIILELDGKDSRLLDWSKGVRQPGMALSGECVVQRQLWLMDSGMSKEEAYDKARKEFYELRQEEEIEKRIAKEEAQYVGAYFGKTRLEIGHELEGKEFERWKTWAAAEAERFRALRAGPEAAPTAEVQSETGESGPILDAAEDL
ncbi:37S ribosomal protein S25, mitochondrial [Scedosporium apiospermum]|uniref:37S ribosomal protein S25, mitochondrial n=1 Tax=Pseudallescheria apiosperma TaxID=563466 RepID=A0A084GFG7_PSEDA|nr:37S ribosomal protein S25, mitochondrial [Scedosporium apiospermum]KEZ46079.1 37S ribosomal protein S25, mitochondrial [Scedosporium apiospermum]